MKDVCITNYLVILKIFSGFRKDISAQQCLITLIETWKKYLDNSEFFRALLTDLSKAFNCVNHGLLIAKLHADGLDYSSLRLIHSCLNNSSDQFVSTLSLVYGVVLKMGCHKG